MPEFFCSTFFLLHCGLFSTVNKCHYILVKIGKNLDLNRRPLDWKKLLCQLCHKRSLRAQFFVTDIERFSIFNLNL